MRRWILAAVFSLSAVSAAFAGETGGGFDGTVIGNVYEYLAAHGCPSGFGLATCGYYTSPPDHRYKSRSSGLRARFHARNVLRTELNPRARSTEGATKAVSANRH